MFTPSRQLYLGVGTYLYEASARPHALTGIADGTAGAGVESGIMQEIGYTAFNKVSHVQHHGGDNDRYEIRYGLDRQRIKSTYAQGDCPCYHTIKPSALTRVRI